MRFAQRVRSLASVAAVSLCAVAGQVHADVPAPSRDLSAYKEAAIPGGDLMLAAYLLGWVLLGAVAVRAALRQRHTEQQLAELEARWGTAETSAASTEGP